MNKLGAFVRLDFITVKPYFTVKNLLIYATVAVFLTAMSQNPASGMGVGMMLGTLFAGYPFAVGERSNMDALYATLAVERKTVVLGRYIFALLLNACAILLSVGLGSAGLWVLNSYRGASRAGDAFAAFFFLFILFVLIQSIQLPFYFKLGYTKARFLSVIPFVAVMSGYMALLGLRDASGGFPQFLMNLLTGGMMVPVVAAALLIAVVFSYSLSIVFYQKREF